MSEPRNILLTGAAGFIGSHLAERLLSEGRRVIGLDDFNDFYDPAIKRRNASRLCERAGFQLVEGDIRDLDLVDRLIASQGFDALIHLAARAGVRPSIEQPLLYNDTNLRGTLNLLESCRKHGVKDFVFGSSSSVYGETTEVPFRESQPADRSSSPYAATKRAGELYGYNYHHLYGMNVTCLRFFTVYGPRQRPEMAIHKFTRLLEQGAEVPVFGDGSTSRDYTYVSDIVDGIVRAADRLDGYKIYNLGNSDPVRLIDLVHAIGAALGKPPRIRWLPEQPGDVPRTMADIARAQEDLGYSPTTAIEDGLASFVAWFRELRAKPPVKVAV